MRRNYIIGGLTGLILGALVYFYGGSRAPSGQPPLRSLTAANLTEIRNEFNSAKREVRVLLLLSPT